MEKYWESVWEVADPGQPYRQVERRRWPVERDAVVYLRNIFDLTDEHFAQLRTGFVETSEGRFTLHEVEGPEPRRWSKWGAAPADLPEKEQSDT